MKSFLFVGLISLFCCSSSAQLDIVIDAQCNIYGAGLTSPPAPGGGGAGILPILVNIPARTKLLAFGSVIGEISCCNGAVGTFHAADGNPLGTTTLNPVGGISGIIHDYSSMFLCGVFLGPGQPLSAPTSEVFSDNTNFPAIQPEIGQVFFIGDGLTGTGDGSIQKFMIPDGATRLFLGFAESIAGGQEAGHYEDNDGQIILNAFAIPEFELHVQVDSCASTAQLTIESDNVDGTEKNYNWRFDEEILPNETNATLNTGMPGEYGAIVTYDLGISSGTVSCDSIFTLEMPDVLPPFSINTTPADCGADNGAVEIDFEGSPVGLTTSLDDGPSESRFDYSNLTAGQHSLTIELTDVCIIDTTFIIIEGECPVYIPNIFSPNDDGVNDIFTMGSTANSTDIAESFEIYDRWGTLIFAQYNSPLFDITWDGTSNGAKVNAGTYFYVLKVNSANGESYSMGGDITVVR